MFGRAVHRFVQRVGGAGTLQGGGAHLDEGSTVILDCHRRSPIRIPCVKQGETGRKSNDSPALVYASQRVRLRPARELAAAGAAGGAALEAGDLFPSHGIHGRETSRWSRCPCGAIICALI